MKTTSLLLLCTTLLAALSSCRQGDENPAAGSPGEIVPEVAVLTVHGTQVPVTANLPGRMEAYLQAEVRARVTGNHSGTLLPGRADGPPGRPSLQDRSGSAPGRAGRMQGHGSARQGRAGGCGGQGRPLFLPGGQGAPSACGSTSRPWRRKTGPGRNMPPPPRLWSRPA